MTLGIAQEQFITALPAYRYLEPGLMNRLANGKRVESIVRWLIHACYGAGQQTLRIVE